MQAYLNFEGDGEEGYLAWQQEREQAQHRKGMKRRPQQTDLNFEKPEEPLAEGGYLAWQQEREQAQHRIANDLGLR